MIMIQFCRSKEERERERGGRGVLIRFDHTTASLMFCVKNWTSLVVLMTVRPDITVMVNWALKTLPFFLVPTCFLRKRYPFAVSEVVE